MSDHGEVVIVDDSGTEHVFPPGFDPVRAGAIVRAQTTPHQDTHGGLPLAATSAAIPAVANGLMELATNPGVAKAGSLVGQLVGGVEGAMHGGPMGAAGGVWTGGKAGWFTSKLMQRLASPAASVAEKVAPYAPTLMSIGGAQGALDLAQMAEPNRRDIGFLGIGPSIPESPAPDTSGNHHPTPSPADQWAYIRDAVMKRLRGQ